MIRTLLTSANLFCICYYLQDEPGTSDPAPPGQLPPVLSPSQPLPPLDVMKGMVMPSDVTADDQVNTCTGSTNILYSMTL